MEAAMVETKVPLPTPRAGEQGLSHEEERVLAEVLAAMRAVRHGYIQLTVQDARVIQIDTTEKHRLV
jgi:hypothetical protein